MYRDSYSPIGIFDSGVGGLTVAKAIMAELPNEDILYFGDTAHLPYGEKSREAIIRYSVEISEFLYSKGIKILVIACNSASAAAYEALCEHWGLKLPIVNVIDPVVDYVCKKGFQKIGIIGTKATINSGVYTAKLLKACNKIEVKAKPTPLLAGMIEEGLYGTEVSKSLIRHYLEGEHFEKMEGLILGCTHYPLIQPEVSAFFNHTIQILDTPKIVADHLKKVLEETGLRSPSQYKGEYHFYLSDLTESFKEISGHFLGFAPVLEQVRL
ncbi:glutamate racemase [Thermaurantimonas aggregans]|uniref:Glutamate racemase n=1 Tax=Thermaurantimonas aggregans TaxID=2173829 RepID=A0A401XK39_9FLAO|nr:glutamate racemase [Thermaurantimonas aggregans]MCX8148548.1 glutamate racemase [Thermaurantimonas aggregans]GCD77378.1 glutamate racemase [Thermaurantimonas aggregans]